MRECYIFRLCNKRLSNRQKVKNVNIKNPQKSINVNIHTHSFVSVCKCPHFTAVCGCCMTCHIALLWRVCFPPTHTKEMNKMEIHVAVDGSETKICIILALLNKYYVLFCTSIILFTDIKL